MPVPRIGRHGPVIQATSLEWEPQFLKSYAASGNPSKSARAAGVVLKTVKQRLAADPEFKERYDAALEEYRDRLEEALGNHHQVVGLIARLKGERPSKYNDKLQVEGSIKQVTVHASADEARDLLRSMLLDATDSTKQQLALPPIAEEP